MDRKKHLKLNKHIARFFFIFFFVLFFFFFFFLFFFLPVTLLTRIP
jgi:hypothetical protein